MIVPVRGERAKRQQKVAVTKDKGSGKLRRKKAKPALRLVRGGGISGAAA